MNKYKTLVCNECGSPNVETLCWCNPNQKKYKGDNGTRVNDYEQDQWCEYCSRHVRFTTMKEFEERMYGEIMFGPLKLSNKEIIVMFLWKLLPYAVKRLFWIHFTKFETK